MVVQRDTNQTIVGIHTSDIRSTWLWVGNVVRSEVQLANLIMTCFMFFLRIAHKDLAGLNVNDHSYVRVHE